MADRAEIPGAAGVAEAHVSAKGPDGAVAMAPPHVLHVDVVDPVAERADELHVVDALVAEMGRIVIEAEALVALDGGDGALGRGDVEGDLGRVNFEAEVHVGLVEGVEDRAEALAEVGETGVPVGLRSRREGVDRVPDAGPGEAVDDGREGVAALAAGLRVEEGAGGLGGEGEFLRGALAHALGIAVAPDVGRENGLVALVDAVADGLADEVVGNRVAGEAVVLEERPFVVDVFFGGDGGLDVEVVAPAGELEAVVTHFFGEGGELGEGKVGPLAGEEGDGAGHGMGKSRGEESRVGGRSGLSCRARIFWFPAGRFCRGRASRRGRTPG